MSTYNDFARTRLAIESALNQDYSGSVEVVVADDGSQLESRRALERYAGDKPRIHLLLCAHRERGWARHSAMERVRELAPDYLLFIDADMILEPHAVRTCIETSERFDAGAVVLRERPFSEATNFVTQVKIFERTVLNNATTPMGPDAIDAARFWRFEAYLQSGGLDPHQLAFEEIQPTIRFMRQGGHVVRADGLLLGHDEKHVTLRALFGKKGEYFKAMKTTAAREEQGLRNMIRRWYPFRRVYYERKNLREYARHPALTSGMVAMYGGLSLLAVVNIARGRLKTPESDTTAT